MVEDNWSLWSLKYNCNSTWQFEFPDEYFLLQRIAKDARRCCREEGSEEKRGRKQEAGNSSTYSVNSRSGPDYQIYILLG
jgi:hypothetical protein